MRCRKTRYCVLKRNRSGILEIFCIVVSFSSHIWHNTGLILFRGRMLWLERFPQNSLIWNFSLADSYNSVYNTYHRYSHFRLLVAQAVLRDSPLKFHFFPPFKGLRRLGGTCFSQTMQQ